MPVTEAVRDYALVPAKSLEEQQLRDFAAAVGRPAKWTLDAWWRRAAPECAVAGVHRDTGVMGGICCARPSEWIIGGQSVPAIGICTWYVAPEHRGKLSGRSLLREFDRPGRFTYAFSVSPDSIAAFHRLGWTKPAPANLLALPLPGAARAVHRILGRPREIEIQEFEAAGDIPNHLAAHLDTVDTARLHDPAAHMRRIAADWRWRLSVAPGRHYLFGVAPEGYVAVRKLARGVALITDVVAVSTDALRPLLLKAAEFADRLHAPALLAVTTNPAPFRKFGFLSFYVNRRAPQFIWQPEGPGEQLGAYSLTPADSDLDLSL